MADGERIEYAGAGTYAGGGFAALLSRYIGQTVTIFTSSGGQSGSGFTGVVLAVSPVFVRLITRIGPPPGCSLGNACTNFGVGYGSAAPVPSASCGLSSHFGGYGAGIGSSPVLPANYVGAVSAGGWDGYPVYTVGSVADIPIASIVSFVHNAV